MQFSYFFKEYFSGCCKLFILEAMFFCLPTPGVCGFQSHIGHRSTKVAQGDVKWKGGNGILCIVNFGMVALWMRPMSLLADFDNFFANWTSFFLSFRSWASKLEASICKICGNFQVSL